MSKQTKLWGVSLLVLAFSCNANAQTCKVPPTCESMGFNQTVTTCNGKTILKCPFNEAKVYCPSAVENNPVYGVGDIYKFNGFSVGIVYRVLSNGYMVSTISRHGNASEATNFCNDLSLNVAYASTLWSLPSRNDYEVMAGAKLINSEEREAYYITNSGKGYYFIGSSLSATNYVGNVYRCVGQV